MAERISHSLLDPWILPLVPPLYRALHIPRWFPPEGIVAAGHLIAIGGAFGFALSVSQWWGGLLIIAGVGGNHLCDMVDGTHARTTGQCRNGGELLDHFVDPLSFSYWMIGLAWSADRLPLAIPAILMLYATSELTNLKAKLIGKFTVARFGPTEYKMLQCLYGLVIMLFAGGLIEGLQPVTLALGWLWVLLAVGAVSVPVNLARAVIQVNSKGGQPDTTDWQLSRQQEED